MKAKRDMGPRKDSGRFGPGNPGKPKGAVAGVTKDLRAMVLGALDDAGGQAYLAQQATEQPAAFMALVGKCLPKDVNLTAKVSLADLIRDARARLKQRNERGT